MSSRTAERVLSVGDLAEFTDPATGDNSVRLMIGAAYASRDGMRLLTVLGSCISVCLFDAEAGVGGMNHFMLPANTRDQIPPSDLRFGTDAMPWLIQAVTDLGARPRRLQAKVFGGGAAMGGVTRIGYSNIDYAREILTQHAIPILAEDVGKTVSRQIRFDTSSGRAYVRYLDSGTGQSILNDEIDQIGQLGS